MLKHGEGFDGCAWLEEVESYAEWLDFEPRLRAKYGDGYTLSAVCLAIRKRDGALIGIMDFRHPLTDFLYRYAGSIGYSVRSSERLCNRNAWLTAADLCRVGR